MLWSQSIKGVMVAKTRDFAQWGGGGVSRELKEVGSRGLRHSIDLVDMYMRADFHIPVNQLVQHENDPNLNTRNTLKRCSALAV